MRKQTLQSAENLARRGISEEIANLYGISETTYRGRSGWKYPIYDADGNPLAHRFKDYDSGAKPKYVWLDGGNIGKSIYGMDTLKALQQDETQSHLFLVNGEPSVWAMRMAGRHAISFSTGESNIPDYFAESLLAHGIDKLIVFPDNDRTGMKAARRLNLLFDSVDIELEFYSVADAWEDLIGGTCRKGADISDLLLAYTHQKIEVFIDQDIGNAVLSKVSQYPLELVDPDAEAEQSCSYQPRAFLGKGDYNPKVIEAVERVLYGQGGRIRRGNELEVLSPSAHTHDSPGEHAMYYLDSHSLFDHARRDWYGLKDLAPIFGIDVDALGGLAAQPANPDPKPKKGKRKLKRKPKPPQDFAQSTDNNETREEQVYDPLHAEVVKFVQEVNERAFYVEMKKKEWEELTYTAQITSWNYQIENIENSTIINQEFLELKELDIDSGAYVIRSAMGTGKTEIAKQLIYQYDRVLVITHRVSLARNLAHRLKMPLYKDFHTVESLQDQDRLIICVNSLDKLTEGNGFEHYDLIVIDETPQVFEHMAGGTFDSVQAVNTFALMGSMIENASTVLLMDANMPQSVVDWVKIHRDDVKVIVNLWQPENAGDWTFYKNRNAIIAKVIQAAKEGKTIAIPCGKTEGRRLEMLLRDNGLSDILVVNQDTVGNKKEERVQGFLENPDKHMPQILIYSPTIGSGVDIQTPIDAIFLVDTISQIGLSANDLVQMMGRFRNCNERHSYVRSEFFGNRSSEQEEVIQERLKRCSRTAQIIGYTDNNTKIYSPLQMEFEELQSHLEAERNRSMNQIPIHMRTIAERTNWNIMIDDTDNDISEQMREIKRKDESEQKEGVLNAIAISDGIYESYQMDKSVTQEVIWGNKKYAIVNFLGKVTERNMDPEITEQEYDTFNASGNRRKLDRFCTLAIEPEILTLLDMLEIEIPIGRRNHYYGTARVLNSLLETLFSDPTKVYTTQDLEYTFVKWRIENPDAEIFLPSRAFKQLTIYKQVRYILGLIGLKMERHQKKYTANGERYTTYNYSLDQEHLAEWERWRSIRKPLLVSRKTERSETNLPPSLRSPRARRRNSFIDSHSRTLSTYGDPSYTEVGGDEAEGGEKD